MANIFNSVKGLHPKRNAFSALTYRNDFTAPLGVNIPVYWEEVPPATRIQCSASALVRLQALIAPVMDNIDYYVHFWKLPYRIIENDRFTQFISGEIEPGEYDALFLTCYELADEVVQKLVAKYEDTEKSISLYQSIFENGGIFDFLGYDEALFPTLSFDQDEQPELTGGNNVTKLNWRCVIAYFMLHQNWYMNENVPYFTNFVELVETLVKDQDAEAFADLLVLTANMHASYGCSFLPHGWEKDYFTSALPNVQYGSPVKLPIAGSAPVTIPGQNVSIRNTTPSLGAQFVFDGNSSDTGSHAMAVNRTEGTPYGEIVDDDLSQTIKGISGKSTDLEGTADLSEASAITINEFRFAYALQVFKERQMRFGRRRLEHYKGFYDVSPEDLRLQVPKYLGGGRIPINISDIEQTSQTDGSQPLGRLAGKATAVAGGFAGFSTFCSEETVILGIAFAMPHITYAQQLSRKRMKTNDPYDYHNPSFEHLGEQQVDNIEIFAGSATPSGTFGYQPRFTEYRFHLNEMHGAFKDSLAYWTLGRIFDSQPALNASFVYMKPEAFDRIFATSGIPPMQVSMIFHVQAIMPLSKYGTPGLLV